MTDQRTGMLVRLRKALGAGVGPGALLYVATLAGQLSAAVARWLIAAVTLDVVAWLTGWPIPVGQLSLTIAFAPLLASLLCLLCPPLMDPIAGRWWEMSCGGRPPEQDEHEAFEQAITQLRAADPTVRAPRHWFVAEDAARNAAAYAGSLRLDRGLLESPYLAAVLAHELAHLRSSDARLTSALNLLLLAPMDTPSVRPLRSFALRGLLWVACGQAVLSLTANAWEMYWRSREIAADEYAARLGLGFGLASALEADSLPHEQPIARMRFSRSTHPYTKPRIVKLRAPGSKQGKLR
jgi:Zn-dependent protease with chaperone function